MASRTNVKIAYDKFSLKYSPVLQARMLCKVSAKEWAEQLNVSYSQLHGWEVGKTILPVSIAKRYQWELEERLGMKVYLDDLYADIMTHGREHPIEDILIEEKSDLHKSMSAANPEVKQVMRTRRTYKSRLSFKKTKNK